MTTLFLLLATATGDGVGEQGCGVMIEVSMEKSLLSASILTLLPPLSAEDEDGIMVGGVVVVFFMLWYFTSSVFLMKIST